MNDEMMFFQRYYIRIREDGAIPLMQAWSSAFDPPPRLEGLSDDILINDRGEGTQFRLEPGGEENPWQSMWDENGIPLFKWNGKKIIQRTKAEIQADRDAIPQPEPVIPIEKQLEEVKERMDIIEGALKMVADTLPQNVQMQIQGLGVMLDG